LFWAIFQKKPANHTKNITPVSKNIDYRHNFVENEEKGDVFFLVIGNNLEIINDIIA
jgi:hypothetical protein